MGNHPTAINLAILLSVGGKLDERLELSFHLFLKALSSRSHFLAIAKHPNFSRLPHLSALSVSIVVALECEQSILGQSFRVFLVELFAIVLLADVQCLLAVDVHEQK